jgi:hypothetical protein
MITNPCNKDYESLVDYLQWIMQNPLNESTDIFDHVIQIREAGGEDQGTVKLKEPGDQTRLFQLLRRRREITLRM